MEFMLLFAAIVGVLAFYGMLWWEGRRGNAAACSRSVWDVGITSAVVGVFGGRLAVMVIDGVNPLTNPADVLIVRAGVSTGFAALFAILTMVVLSRGETWEMADALSAAALAGLAGWHGACVVRDACLGTPSTVPWAITQPGSTIGRHPVEVYAALMFALAAVALALWKAKGRPRLGVPAGVALAAASTIRLVTEPMRPRLSNEMVAWYTVGIVAGLAVVVWRWAAAARSSGDGG